MRLSVGVVVAVALVGLLNEARAEDWPQFRGPRGDGVSHDGPVPLRWSANEHLKWSVDLPGPGSSSPIVVGNRVFVTCYSGYGASNRENDPSRLTRHLVCVDRDSGKILWSTAVPSKTREDSYQGFLTEHGYASSTPVSDGERVYAFFGKSGVIACDMDGKLLWQVNVGTDSSNRRWGSAASLVLHGDAVIVNASEESVSIRALNRETGAELWKTEAGLLELAYGTPAVTKTSAGRDLIVLAVPEEVWALNPANGKLVWYCETNLTGNISPSVNIHNGIAYVFGGFRGAGSMAIDINGRDDVTKSNVKWTSRTSSYVATPVLHEGHLYWIDDRGTAYCTDAATGETVYRERLVSGSGGRPVYASPVLCQGRLYIPSRWQGVYVLQAGPEFKLLSQNRLDDDSDFNATPAISGTQMFLRSNRALYCIE